MLWCDMQCSWRHIMPGEQLHQGRPFGWACRKQATCLANALPAQRVGLTR